MSVDLSNCDREPIHIIGRIQSFGVLLAISSDWIVVHASRNIADHTARSADDLIGRPARDLLADSAIHSLRTRLQMLGTPESVERLFSIELFGDGRLFDVALHVSGPSIVIEAEVASPDTLQQYINYVRPMTDRVKQGKTTQQMCEIAARQLRALTGFDRVMVYRFDPDNSGEVIAESRRNGVDGFLGLHFPASDIPEQARRLYMRNMLRIISDVNDPTVEVIPAVDPDGHALDLTMSSLRAVSPIHIEYLRNMDVEASLSVSIMREGQLWGLFACHHYSPRILPYPLRTAAELFGELFAFLLDQSENAHSRAQQRISSALHDRLMSRLAEGTSLIADFEEFAATIAQVIPHDGIAALVDGEYVALRYAPDEEEFAGLARFLNTTGTSKIWSTEHLESKYAPATGFSDRVAGLLALPVSRQPRDYIVLFRRAMAQTVKWAGNPEKQMTSGPLGDRLTPRKSFEEWKQEVTGRSSVWSKDEMQYAESLRITLLEVVLRLTERATSERIEAGKRQEILIAELNHRVRNILNLIRSLVTQSQHKSASVEEYAELLGSRIHALARAHDQLTRANWEATALRTLIAIEASSYLQENASRLAVLGVHAVMSPGALTTLAMVFHELMTNSTKYGALSVPEGKVTIRLIRESDDSLTIVWKESDGPEVQQPQRRGFGSTIIERSIPHELDGEAETIYARDGFVAKFSIPAAHIAQYSAAHDAEDVPPLREPVFSPSITLPENVLIVEDNVLIAMEAEELAVSLGAKRVYIAANVRDALRKIRENLIGLAIVDVNLGSETSEEVAIELRDRGVAFLMATGYGDGVATAEAFAEVPVVTKPYTATELTAALAQILETG